MRSLRFIFITLITSLFVTNVVFLRRTLSVLLCGVLSFNSTNSWSLSNWDKTANAAIPLISKAPPSQDTKLAILADFKDTKDIRNQPVTIQGPEYLIAGTNGLLYGFTGGQGDIFQFDPNNSKITYLARFNPTQDQGSEPTSLIAGANGLFYGTTHIGGGKQFLSSNIFQFEPSDSKITKLASLEQEHLYSNPLVAGANGLFYGTTRDTHLALSTGTGNDIGTIFQFESSNNKITKLVEFNTEKGLTPSGLVKSVNGLFYGTTLSGGVFGSGTLFKFNPNNKTITKLIDFKGGAGNGGTLYSGENGLLYGVGMRDDKSLSGKIYQFNPSDNKITPLVSLDDETSNAKVVSHPNGMLYGYTSKVVFEFNPQKKTLTKLVKFRGSYNEEGFPSSLIVGSDGLLYGTSIGGGKYADGIVFSIQVPNNKDVIKGCPYKNLDDYSKYNHNTVDAKKLPTSQIVQIISAYLLLPPVTSFTDKLRGVLAKLDEARLTPEGEYHYYKLHTEVCKLSKTCTRELVYKAMLSKRKFTAPNIDRSSNNGEDPVKDCEVVKLRNPFTVFGFFGTSLQTIFGGDGLNPIYQVITNDNYEVRNNTMLGHILHPGYVTRRVIEKNNSILIETVGEGIGGASHVTPNGLAPLVNIVEGGELFLEVDQIFLNAFKEKLIEGK